MKPRAMRSGRRPRTRRDARPDVRGPALARAGTAGVALALGTLMGTLGWAWMRVAHTVALPPAWLLLWPEAWSAQLGWAYLLHSVLLATLPLAVLGGACGWLLRAWMAGKHDTLPRAPAQSVGRTSRLLGALPWLLGYPLVSLGGLLHTAAPLQAGIGLLAGGQWLPAWLSLPVAWWWASRVPTPR